MKIKKINLTKILTTNKVAFNIDDSENIKINNFEELKAIIECLVKKKVLDYFRFDKNYLNVMQNAWLLDKPILKYGILDNKKDIANTLSAYQNALNLNSPLLISVQVLKDNNIICFRDKTFSSVANINGYVKNFMFDEIKEIKLNNSDSSIPLLADALNLIRGEIPIVIEIINESLDGKYEEIILKELLKYIETYNCYDKIAILSANPYSLEWFYSHAPYLTRVIKSGFFKDIKEYANIKTKKLKKLKFANSVAHADFIVYNAKDIPNPYINKQKPYGVIANDIISQKEYEEILEFADNIIFTSFEPKI